MKCNLFNHGLRKSYLLSTCMVFVLLLVIQSSLRHMLCFNKGLEKPKINMIDQTRGLLTSGHFETFVHTCTPRVDCIKKRFPFVKSLKNGFIKQSPNQRTIYFKTMGRLGNLLYSFGAMLAWSKATCAHVVVSTPHDLKDIFEEVPFQVLSDKDFKERSRGKSYFNCHRNHSAEEIAIETALHRDITVEGVFAAPFWFMGCLNETIHKLRLKNDYIKKGKRMIEMIKHKSGRYNVTTVGLHVRRGDKVTKSEYHLPKSSYFDKAMAYYRNKHTHILFIVTTDDWKWAKDNFNRVKQQYNDVAVAPRNSYQIDFAILSQCDFIIQSEGTFSQWAAIVNGRESVYFKDNSTCTPEKPKCGAHNWPEWIPMTN